MVKHRITVSVDYGLWSEATARGLNISGILHVALVEQVGDQFSSDDVTDLEIELKKKKRASETGRSYKSEMNYLFGRWMKARRWTYSYLPNLHWISEHLRRTSYIQRHSPSSIYDILEGMRNEEKTTTDEDGTEGSQSTLH